MGGWANIALCALAALGIVLGAGYFVVLEGKTALGKKVQDWIWEEQVSQMAVYKADFAGSVTYTDSGSFTFVPSKIAKKYGTTDQAELDEIDSQYGFTLKDVSAGTTATGYFNFENTNDLKGYGWFDGKFVNNGKSYEAQLNAKLVNNMLFSRYDYNANVAQMVSRLDSAADPDKGQWIRETDQYSVDQFISELKQLVTDSQQGIGGITQEQKDILKNYRLLKIKDFKGLETINGKSTMHYSLELNKPKFKALVKDYILKDVTELTDSQKKKLTDSIVKKVNINEYEIWIGATDRKIYKYNLSVDMISLAKSLEKINSAILKGTFDDVTEGSQGSARDAKRVSDVRQMATAAELYYDDHGSYPKGKNGAPQDVEEYIFDLPKAPTPADGSCSKSDNTYKYVQTKSGNGFEITFCLGEDAGYLKKGKRTMTESGFKESDYSTGGSTTNASDKEMYDKLIKLWDSLPFKATLSVNYNVFDYDINKSVWPPNPYKDRSSYYYPMMSGKVLGAWDSIEDKIETK